MFALAPGVISIILLSPIITALNLPQLITSINQNIADNLTTPSGFGVCFSHSKPTSDLPKYSDCEKVIRQRLPYHPGKATFHSTGVDDAFRLPIYEEWGDCAIMVVIGGHQVTRDESSWLDIHRAATEINEVCRVDGRTGGKIQVGDERRVWIKLSKVMYGGAVNGSMASAENVNVKII
ncbi:hypothetical protein ACLMJK_004277 [Lecanora helva]